MKLSIIKFFFFVIEVYLHVTLDAVSNPEEFVRPLAGSFTDGDKFSTGNTLPLIGRPWGFNHWSPQTKEANRFTGSWWFKGSDHVFTWLRCTHQPSPWIGDWGYFVFTPILTHWGQGVTRDPEHYWEPRGAVIKPYLFDATVAPYNVRMELTPTDHAAILRVTFPSTYVTSPGENPERLEKRVCFAEAQWESAGPVIDGGGIGGQFIKGRATQVHQDRMIISGFAMYVWAESLEASGSDRHDDMICFKFNEAATTVVIRMATSFLSYDQARVNFKREIKYAKSFDQIAKESKAVWRNILKRVDVVDAGEVSDFSNKNLAIFYTGLYRALLFPRRIDELSHDSQVVHYSPYNPHFQSDSAPHRGIAVTDNGFWDTYRTVYPLLSLAYPDHLANIIQGWLNAYSEGGWLPSWASPGYRNCMVGTFADVVIADAIVKGVSGFDIMLAKDALLKDAFEEPPKFSDGAVGKLGLKEYMQNGYLSSDNRGAEVVSRTVDYGFADFSTSQALTEMATSPLYDHYFDSEAKAGLLRSAESLRGRSSSAYRSLYNSRFGLLTPKNYQDFSAVEWGNGYTEGSPWHHSFPPYGIYTGDEQNLGELVSLHGGKEKLLQKLRDLLNTPGNFKFGSYREEIHEMVEMRAVAMGQYGHNNQPCHHLLYLFALLGDKETTQCLVRKVMDRAYGEDFYAGDEDNGEQGAWFVLSALGLYSVTPGTKGYVLGSPLFRHVRISRDPEINVYDNYYEFPLADEPLADKVASKGLDIVSKGAGSHVCMVEKVMLNGTLISGVTVQDADIQRDGVLRFVMLGEGEDESAYYSRDNFNMLSAKQLQLATASEVSHMTQTIEEQNVKLQQLNAELETLRAQAAAAKKAVPVKVTIAEPERNTHKVEENLTEGNSLFDLHHPLGVIAIMCVCVVCMWAIVLVSRRDNRAFSHLFSGSARRTGGGIVLAGNKKVKSELHTV